MANFQRAKVAGFLIVLVGILLTSQVTANKILIPMDLTQADHLRAYGVAYFCLEHGTNVEWLLNFRGGSFMVDAIPEVEKIAKLRGVTYSILSGSDAAGVYAEIQGKNMDVVLLEKAPRLCVYVAPNPRPWDDAVRLALDYAQIPYQKIWDEEILAGGLEQYDWFHIHHEDFTGQFGKFYANYRGIPWYEDEVSTNNKYAKKLGFKKVSQMKLAVAKKIKEYINKGGFLFAVCSGPATLDEALAAENTDIVPQEFDDDPVAPDCNNKLDYSKTLAFQNFHAELNPYVYATGDIDCSNDALLRGPQTYFSLFEFSAKYDPIPTMLTQDHVSLVNEFMGQNTGFHKDKVKPACTVLAEVSGTDEVKYLYGTLGKGLFSFYGGHDPEQFQHRIGNPPTKLELHKNSPGFRIILNNVLFPAAKKKELKT